MKSTLLASAIVLTASLCSQSADAIGPVSSPGWYYTTVSYASGSATFGRNGPFSTKAECDAVRWNDYGDGGSIPWDGGPGCFYLHDNDIWAYNELLEHWNLATGPNTGLPSLDAEMEYVLSEVNVLIEHHAIRNYREAMNKVSNIQPRKAEEKGER
ncbi:hypothetical protein [Pleionea litopenaei]|uniref:Uncharacterized protein n=1 Tax=Pleionea litopenaei TaxID=3070815 RepID=A0AA51RTI5_9GAMM|nr:hypothetical protein [Pleionea sp. HL-JVS1]WMS87342.1 hypothetical protein Q9312_00080 [Pleionea sp. HL-JVS1]